MTVQDLMIKKATYNNQYIGCTVGALKKHPEVKSGINVETVLKLN